MALGTRERLAQELEKHNGPSSTVAWQRTNFFSGWTWEKTILEGSLPEKQILKVP